MKKWIAMATCGLLAFGVAGCGEHEEPDVEGVVAPASAAAESPKASPTPSVDKTTPPSVPSPTVATVRLPETTPYAPNKFEPTPKFKKAAAHYLETLLSYGAGEGGIAAAKARLKAAGLPTGPAAQAERLLKDPGPSAVQIVYPQSGGQTSSAGSVMASLMLHRVKDGRAVTSSRTMDVRLQLKSGKWTVVEIASDGGKAPKNPNMEAGASVMKSDKVFVTDSMRWDAESGIMDQRVFDFIEDFSKKHDLKLTVFKTGHPYFVFGKKAVSYHSRGRAFDIWEIDGVTVAEWGKRPGKDNPAHELMARALELGSNEVGGPWAFSTSRGKTFTNLTHLDHLHIGFKST